MKNTNRLSSTKINTADFPVEKLRSAFDGRLIAPADAGYDEARRLNYGGMEHRPALIIRAKNAGDIQRAETLARDSGSELSIRSGGHSLSGHGVSDGGVMLDLSQMKAMRIDAENHTAWAESGLSAGEYTTAVAEHGLVTGFGDTATVGIGGITLGGGVGYLVRKLGLTIDQLLAAEMVSADGKLLQVNDEVNPDLFWAIRGGGGNFGVVTRFHYRLHELDRFTGACSSCPPNRKSSPVHRRGRGCPVRAIAIVSVMKLRPCPSFPPRYTAS